MIVGRISFDCDTTHCLLSYIGPGKNCAIAGGQITDILDKAVKFGLLTSTLELTAVVLQKVDVHFWVCFGSYQSPTGYGTLDPTL